jgi:YfiH family protein
MSLFFDARGVLQSELLSQFSWLDHGFSTKHSASWIENRPLAFARQIHSADVLTASAPGPHSHGDSLITSKRGIYVGVKTADCFPILLVDPEHRAVAAVHSGWRGTTANILSATLGAMSGRFSTTPNNVRAAVGPGIQECCFEVGPEVAVRFGRVGRCRVALATTLHQQLITLGVKPTHVESAADCTFCGNGQFWSYRREGEAAGRMWSAVGMIDPP